MMSHRQELPLPLFMHMIVTSLRDILCARVPLGAWPLKKIRNTTSIDQAAPATGRRRNGGFYG